MPKPWSYDPARWKRLYASTTGIQGVGRRETDRLYYMAACGLWGKGNDCGCYNCTETARWEAAKILELDRICWQRWTDVLLIGEEYGLLKLSYDADGYLWYRPVVPNLSNWPRFKILKKRRLACPGKR